VKRYTAGAKSLSMLHPPALMPQRGSGVGFLNPTKLSEPSVFLQLGVSQNAVEDPSAADAPETATKNSSTPTSSRYPRVQKLEGFETDMSANRSREHWKSDGLAVGEADGSAVGVADGSAVGLSDGLAVVGEADGSPGRTVGSKVGAVVGSAVGWTVGG